MSTFHHPPPARYMPTYMYDVHVRVPFVRTYPTYLPKVCTLWDTRRGNRWAGTEGERARKRKMKREGPVTYRFPRTEYPKIRFLTLPSPRPLLLSPPHPTSLPPLLFPSTPLCLSSPLLPPSPVSKGRSVWACGPAAAPSSYPSPLSLSLSLSLAPSS
ncbi:hypothetical protein LX32DRAFT_408230 [Colletotrichum zoysiae]|uniref:Uncharacterized protein n=1 Tax=Colletotrichum zoysiae TaxID=1216348 RepID=A0AAD9HHK8_9PEZI|nr:hypothetical protein LX32DRAFT_408230 [Colletotrichum zoysiae]